MLHSGDFLTPPHSPGIPQIRLPGINHFHAPGGPTPIPPCYNQIREEGSFLQERGVRRVFSFERCLMTEQVSPEIQSAPANPPRHGGGPRTPAGRARSALNGLKHGLCARTVLLPNEDPQVYVRFCKQILDYWKPANAMEQSIAQLIANDCWRLERSKTHEQGFMALGHGGQPGEVICQDAVIHAAITEAGTFRDNPQAFATLSIYEQRITRSIHKNMKVLQEMQKERKAAEQAAMDEAVLLHNYHKMLGEAFDPKEYEFVYSADQVSREAARRQRLEEAKNAQRVRFKLSEFRAWRQKQAPDPQEAPAA